MPVLSSMVWKRLWFTMLCILLYLILVAQGKRLSFQRTVTENKNSNERIATIRMGNMLDEFHFDLSSHHLKSRTITYDYNHSLVDKTIQNIRYDAYNNPSYMLSTTLNTSGIVIEGAEEVWNNNDLIQGQKWGQSGGRQWAELYNNNKDDYENTAFDAQWQTRFSYTPPVSVNIMPGINAEWNAKMNEFNQNTAPVTIQNSRYGEGGKTELSTSRGNGVITSERKVYDARGVLREYHYVESYPDDYSHEEITYYNCEGVPVYFTATLWDDEEEVEINMLDLVFVNGQPVAGIKDVDDYDESFRQYYNPQTGQFEFLEYGERDYEDYFMDLKSLTDPCDERDNNFISAGPRLLLEDAYPERFNMFGGYVQYTHQFNPKLGATVDVGYTAGSQYEWNYSRLNIVAGVNYYPFGCADAFDTYSLSAHIYGGLSSVTGKYEYNGMSYSNKNSGFALYGGIEGGIRINKTIGAELNLDFNPNFYDGNTTKNWIISAGINYRF